MTSIRFFLFSLIAYFNAAGALLPPVPQILEVRLNTKTTLQPIYLSRLHSAAPRPDWRYPEELREALAFDLANTGYSSLVLQSDRYEEKINWPDPRSSFDLNFWKQEKIPFVVTIQATKQTLSVAVFNTSNGSAKRYSDIELTLNPDIDRPAIHRLADAIQKDLFHAEGICSHRLIFSQRSPNPEQKGPEWLSDLWICDFDGMNAKKLPCSNGYCMSPCFLPKIGKSKLCCYVSHENGQSKIYRADISQAKSELWIHLRGNQMLPAISPSANQIAFITDIAGRPDLFVQNLDRDGKETGRPRQLFSAPKATQASPTYSPDGKKIAFVSDKDGTPRIYTLDIKNPQETARTKPTLISKRCRENTSPSWSPDGSKLAYSARTDGVRQIWIYDFQTDEERQITSGPDNKENPSWAPNSLHLVYNTETNDVSELFLIDLIRQEPVQISSGFGQKRFASWESQAQK